MRHDRARDRRDLWRPRVAIVELTDQHPDFAQDRRTCEEAAQIRALFRSYGYGVCYGDATNTVFVRDPPR